MITCIFGNGIREEDKECDGDKFDFSEATCYEQMDYSSGSILYNSKCEV